MPKTLFFCLLFVMVFCSTGYPEVPEVEARFTEIIIKVKPDVILMPEGKYKVPVDELEITSDEIKELNRKFNLVSIERMFARKRPAEEVAREFPEREARAPKDAKELDLGNTFLLKFPDLINADVIIDEYGRVEEVIYAEENIVLSIF